MKDGTYKEYEVHWLNANDEGYRFDAPKAYVKNNDGEYLLLKEANDPVENSYNEIRTSQKVLLEIGNIHEDVNPVNQKQGEASGDVLGEAIYYSVYIADREDAEPLIEKRLYRGGVYLPTPEEGDSGLYRIETYGISYGKVGPTSVYYFNINPGHSVLVNNGSDVKSYTYSVNDKVRLNARPAENKYFDE